MKQIKCLGLVLAFVMFGGCATTAWQPMNPSAPKVVYVTEQCQVRSLHLPPRPQSRHCGDSGCYDRKNAEQYTSRMNAMEDWITEVRSKCAVMEYRPTDYKLLPPYRRSSAISVARLRLTGSDD